MMLDRDEWMRRTGPFYPGLIALFTLTVVRFPKGLEPTGQDYVRSAIWFPVVGAAVGAVLALTAELLLWLGLVPALVALLVILVAIVMTGLGMTMNAARTFQRMCTDERSYRSEDRLYGPSLVALIGFLSIRVMLLWTTATSEWSIALVYSEVISYWTVVLLLYMSDPVQEPSMDDSTMLAVGRVSPSGLGMGSAAAGGITLALVFLSGAAVILAAVSAAAVAFALGLWFQRRFGGVANSSLATVVCVSELLVLLVFCVTHPATVSPWIQ